MGIKFNIPGRNLFTRGRTTQENQGAETPSAAARPHRNGSAGDPNPGAHNPRPASRTDFPYSPDHIVRPGNPDPGAGTSHRPVNPDHSMPQHIQPDSSGPMVVPESGLIPGRQNLRPIPMRPGLIPGGSVNVADTSRPPPGPPLGQSPLYIHPNTDIRNGLYLHGSGPRPPSPNPSIDSPVSSRPGSPSLPPELDGGFLPSELPVSPAARPPLRMSTSFPGDSISPFPSASPSFRPPLRRAETEPILGSQFQTPSPQQSRKDSFYSSDSANSSPPAEAPPLRSSLGNAQPPGVQTRPTASEPQSNPMQPNLWQSAGPGDPSRASTPESPGGSGPLRVVNPDPPSPVEMGPSSPIHADDRYSLPSQRNAPELLHPQPRPGGLYPPGSTLNRPGALTPIGEGGSSSAPSPAPSAHNPYSGSQWGGSTGSGVE